MKHKHIRRYAIHTVEVHKQGGMYGEESYTICDLREQEHPDGNWVKWEDVKKYVERDVEEV